MNRQYGLDLARLMAAFFVALGHLAFGGTFSVDAPYQQWTQRGELLPLLNKDLQSLWKLDYFLLVHWQTSAGIVGVGLFFVISGWVVPPMLKRYNTRQFLCNRLYRIFPMLMVSVLVAALVQYTFGNREALGTPAVLATMLLLNDFTGQPMTLGVVWTLIVEFKFYLILALVGQLNNAKIFGVVAAFFGLCGVYYLLTIAGVAKTNGAMQFFGNAVLRDLHYVVLMLIASSFQVALGNSQKPAYLRFAPVVSMILAFNLGRNIVVKGLGIQPWQDINVVTQLIIFSFFLTCLVMQRYGTRSLFASIIKEVSDITYSLYLLHLSLGIFLLSVMRHIIPNQSLLVFAVLILISAVSFASYHGIEKRFRYRVKPA